MGNDRTVESQVPEDVAFNDIFVKLTEESRRERQYLIDAGDTEAKLTFPWRHTAQAGTGFTPELLAMVPKPKAQPKAAAPTPKGAAPAMSKAAGPAMTKAAAPAMSKAGGGGGGAPRIIITGSSVQSGIAGESLFQAKAKAKAFSKGGAPGGPGQA